LLDGPWFLEVDDFIHGVHDVELLVVDPEFVSFDL
jgi:hypothetical protein